MAPGFCSEHVRKFKHQQLASISLDVTTRLFGPIYGIVGVFLIIIGIVMYCVNKDAKMFHMDYTEICRTHSGEYCYDRLTIPKVTPGPKTCECTFNFTLDEDFVGDVNFFYHLEEFYQNEKRYVKSRYEDQLSGDEGLYDGKLPKPCAPYGPNDSRTNPPFYVPCGIVANSLFTDTFKLEYVNEDLEIENVRIETIHGLVEKAGLLTERKRKFKNPTDGLDVGLENKPPAWPEELYAEHFIRKTDEESGLQYPPLVIWMDNSPFSSFSKLWGYMPRVETLHGITGLPAGYYIVRMNYTYPMHDFFGRKSFVITNDGGHGVPGTRLVKFANGFLGLGGVFLALAAYFGWLTYRLRAEKKHRLSKSEMTYLPTSSEIQ